MDFLRVILLLLVVPLLVVESSSLNDTSSVINNITRGSSLSTSSNDTSGLYWLSPSGNIAFGFYQLACTRSSPNCTDMYVVGIWFVKSPLKTLVWTANSHEFPYHKPSSILFTNDGKLMLHVMPDNVQKPLIPDVKEPVAYVVMQDDGNFVLYNSDSQVIWQSFDYPTNTILGGQKLRPGAQLISGGNRLSVQQTDGVVAVVNQEEKREIISKALKGSLSVPVVLSLDITGELYLVGADDVLLKYLYRNKNRHRKQKEEGSVLKQDAFIYRATLETRGYLNLFKERIDGNINDHEKSSILVRTLRPIHHMSRSMKRLIACLIVMGSLSLLVSLFYCWLNGGCRRIILEFSGY